MVLNLKSVFAGGETLTFEYALDLSGLEAYRGEYPLREPVRVTGKVVNRAGLVTLEAEARFTYKTECDRCLKEIAENLEVKIENILATEMARESDDGEIIVCSDETLDMDELVTTNIILSLSMKHLCRPDCKGLCPKCGKNLNEGDCGCDKGYVNPVFSQLKDMFNE